MSSFEDHLWRELVTEHGDELARMTTSRPTAQGAKRGVLLRRPARLTDTGLAWMRSWRRRTAVAVSVAVLAGLGAGSALAYHFLGPSPGFTAGLTGLESLPTVPWPSSIPKDSLPQLAEATGLSPSEAEQRLRLVQSGLSLGDARGVSLYALPGNAGTGCIFLTGQGSICLPTWMTTNPALDSVAWAAWGGASAAPAGPGPLAAFGLVADDVRQVEVDISGVTDKIPIEDNSFYEDINSITRADTIKLIVRFDDGTTRTFDAPNPYSQDKGPSTKIIHLHDG
jgi:hypothetical protein